MKKVEEEFNYLIELSGKVLTGQIEVEKFEKHRTIFLNEYGQKQQPEIPEFVAAEIEGKNHIYGDFRRIANITHYSEDVRHWYYAKPYHAEIFYRAILDGYTVAKEKRFYVKVNEMYFVSFSDTAMNPTFVLNDMPGRIEEAHIFKKYDEAQNVAKIIGGAIVPVEEEE